MRSGSASGAKRLGVLGLVTGLVTALLFYRRGEQQRRRAGTGDGVGCGSSSSTRTVAALKARAPRRQSRRGRCSGMAEVAIFSEVGDAMTGLFKVNGVGYVIPHIMLVLFYVTSLIAI